MKKLGLGLLLVLCGCEKESKAPTGTPEQKRFAVYQECSNSGLNTAPEQCAETAYRLYPDPLSSPKNAFTEEPEGPRTDYWDKEGNMEVDECKRTGYLVDSRNEKGEVILRHKCTQDELDP